MKLEAGVLAGKKSPTNFLRDAVSSAMVVGFAPLSAALMFI